MAIGKKWVIGAPKRAHTDAALKKEGFRGDGKLELILGPGTSSLG
jgi:hypothetical protein